MSGKPTSCTGCSLADKGRGFCLGVGDPEKARLAIVLEAVSDAEIGFFLNTPMLDVLPDARVEVLRRQSAFPEMEKSAIVKGMPAVGRAGSILNGWLLPKVGIVRSEIFVDSTLRCVPMRSKTGKPYPTGKEKNIAEYQCRKFDRLRLFRPDAIVLTFHPSTLMAEVTTLPLMLKDLEKAQSFVKQGLKTLVLMGGHAAEVFLGYGSNVSRWRGHYELTANRGGADAWYERVMARAALRAKIGSGKRKSKSAQLAAGNAAVLNDGLDVIAVKVRKKPGCRAMVDIGVCGVVKAEHPTLTCAKYVAAPRKPKLQPSADDPKILCIDESLTKSHTMPESYAPQQLAHGAVECGSEIKEGV